MNTAPLRAMARIASRSARRNVRRSLLVVAMVAIPIALVTATATVARTIVGTPDDEVAATMGSADALLNVGRGLDRDRLMDGLPHGSDVVALRLESEAMVRQGELVFSTLVEPDTGLDNPVLHGMYDLGSGTAPTAPGEAAVNERLLDSFGAEIGDDIEIGEHQLRVTGIVEARDLEHPIAIVGSGTLTGRNGVSKLLIDLPKGASAESLALADACPLASGLHDARRDRCVRCKRSHDLGSCLLGGWDSRSLRDGSDRCGRVRRGARRQLRELGLVGAVGGEPRHVRAVVWVGGTTLGLIGGAVGSSGGVVLALAIHPFLDDLVGRVVGPLDVNPLVLAAAILMGTAAATLSALGPAVDRRQVECHGGPCWSNGTTPTTGKGRCLRADRSDSRWRRHCMGHLEGRGRYPCSRPRRDAPWNPLRDTSAGFCCGQIRQSFADDRSPRGQGCSAPR